MQDFRGFVQHHPILSKRQSGRAQPVVARLVIRGVQFDYELASIPGDQRAIDHAFDVHEIVTRQPRNR